jgi:hypothetical protein
MGIETDIHKALIGRVETLVTDLPIDYPGTPFTPPEGDYIRVTHIRNEPERWGLLGSSPMDYAGILWIDLFRRVSAGTWQVTSDALAEAIADHFPRDLRLTSGSTQVIVYKTFLDLGEKDPNTTHWRTAIKVFYRSN